MGARILVVEDEDTLSEILEYNLSSEGFLRADLVRPGRGSDDGAGGRPARPDVAGLDAARVVGHRDLPPVRARAEMRDMPIIMMTARGEESDRIRGLDTGADDYLTKPFSIPELTARVRALLRRARPTIASDMATFGDLALDRETRRVHRANREIHLGPTEFRLLDCLMQRPGRVYSREQLLDLVWGRDVYVEVRTVDVHIGRLRKALNGRNQRDPIRTVRAAGYALDETYPG